MHKTDANPCERGADRRNPRWKRLGRRVEPFEELAIDWTGLETRTYSVRLLYREVAAEAPEVPMAVEKAPVVPGGNPACWWGPRQGGRERI